MIEKTCPHHGAGSAFYSWMILGNDIRHVILKAARQICSHISALTLGGEPFIRFSRGLFLTWEYGFEPPAFCPNPPPMSDTMPSAK